MRKLPRLSPARVAVLIAALVVGYFVFSAVGDALLSHRLGQEEQQLRDEIDDLSRDQRRLEAIRDFLRSDEYVESVARRVLGLAKPGETVFIVASNVEPTPEPTPIDGEDDGSWWERLYGE